MSTVPIVSVWMVTYNHQDYITQAVESVMMQQTDFNVHLFIGEDFSSDNTRVICQSLKQKYPNKITLILNEKNLGPNKNAKNIYEACFNSKAKYIAMLEGDDYWTDPLKLQKQVNLLESNPQLVACHHWQKLAVNKGNFFEEIEAPKEGHGYFPFETGVKSIFENKMRVKARTVMFRNIFEPSEIMLNFPNASFGDVPLSFVLGRYGKFGFIDEEMAVYRQTNSGISKAGLKELGIKKFRVQHFKNWIEIWDYADKFYDFKFHKEATKTVLEFYKTITANLPVTIPSLIKVLYYDIFERKLPFRYKLTSLKWIIIYYRKKLGYKLKRKFIT
tara:strand:- start:193 stop:1185 length:993 start_codon:yes stop_codon:yes gene_type:complete